MTERRSIFLEGKRFGKLVAIKYVKVKKYLCQCDCGSQKIIQMRSLRKGYTTSCGCIDSVDRQNYDEDMRGKLLNSIEKTSSGCWEWKKSRHRQGYGNFPYKRKVLLAHRVAWKLFKGDLDDKILVCHRCDNPPCCNPDHLFLGTDRDNTRDAFAKGRVPRRKGEDHYCAKLTNEIILEIRRLADEGMKYADISKKLNVKIGNISGIVTKNSWKHVD